MRLLAVPSLIALFALTTGCADDISSAPDEVRLFDAVDEGSRDLAIELAAAQLDELVVLHELDSPADFALSRVGQDVLGMAHVRYQQHYRGVRVFGGETIVHLQPDGALSSITDALVGGLELDVEPLYVQSEGEELAIDASGLTALSKDPHTELVVVRFEAVDRLAWMVQLEDMEAAEPTMPLVFVDAHTGEAFWQLDNLRHLSDETATGTTNYYGTVDIDVTLDTGFYITEDLVRGIGTYSWSNGTSGLSYVADTGDVFDESWQTQAVEAHYGGALVFDYYENVLGRDGLDDAGGPGCVTGRDGSSVITLGVNYSSSYNNAFWYPDATCPYMVFGDGDGSTFDPLTTVDITGHEMTHGVTSFTASFTYYSESGALDEACADIFGSMVERYAFGESSDTWDIGEDSYTPSTAGDALRYMDDPTADGYSRDYYGDRYRGGADNAGVHWNSGIGNHQFYLMVNGGTHATYPSLGEIMEGLDADVAAEIWYRALANYLTSSSDYSDAQVATLQAADDLYGTDSLEYYVTQDAWYLVGVGSASSNLDNTTPVADAGVDDTASLGDTVTLDGSGSSDPDGDALTYSWTFTSVPASSALTDSDLSSTTSSTPDFTPDEAGDYTLELTVDDGVLTATDSVTVTVEGTGGTSLNDPPVADAGSDAAVTLGDAATLDASGSSDPDGDALTYRWKLLSVPAGSALTSSAIGDRDTDITSFTPDAAGTFIANVKVTDPEGETDQAQVTFTVTDPNNTAPTADLSATATSADIGDTVTLDATNSSDPEGGNLSYRWKFIAVPGGSALGSNDISDRDAGSTSFTPDVLGNYVVNIKVTDNGGLTDSTQLTIQVIDPNNAAPTANAGANGTYAVGDTVTLDGSGSSDPDGDVLTYRWKFINLPGSSALTSNSIADRDAATTSFVPDAAGTYKAVLKVDDGSLKDADSVRFTITD